MGRFLDDLERHLRGEDGVSPLPIQDHQMALIGAAATAEGAERTAELLNCVGITPEHHFALKLALADASETAPILSEVAAAMSNQPLIETMLKGLKTLERMVHEQHRDPLLESSC